MSPTPRKRRFETPDPDTVALTDARINPATGLATEYLNRFNEAVMLLDMLSSCPKFRDDFLAWKPMSYREHFRLSPSQDPRSRNRRLRQGRSERPKHS